MQNPNFHYFSINFRRQWSKGKVEGRDRVDEEEIERSIHNTAGLAHFFSL